MWNRDFLILFLGAIIGICLHHLLSRKGSNLMTKRKLTPSNTDKIINNIKDSQAPLKTKVVIIVPTPIVARQRRDFVHRQFLRENWDKSDAVILYVVGSKDGKRLEFDLDMAAIHKEHKQTGRNFVITACRDYGDEVRNANGTSSTTCKVYEGIKYAYKHYKADYLFRGADDSYINLNAFFELMSTYTIENRKGPWYMGNLRRPHFTSEVNDLVLRNNNPELQDLFGIYSFGQYMIGGGYILTWDVAAHIASWIIPPHQTFPEDAIVGMWLNPFQIKKIDEKYNFPGTKDMKVRSARRILIHYMLTEQHWASIDNNGTFHFTDGLQGCFPLFSNGTLMPIHSKCVADAMVRINDEANRIKNIRVESFLGNIN